MREKFELAYVFIQSLRHSWTPVTEHLRRVPSGGFTTVRGHQRLLTISIAKTLNNLDDTLRTLDSSSYFSYAKPRRLLLDPHTDFSPAKLQQLRSQLDDIKAREERWELEWEREHREYEPVRVFSKRLHKRLRGKKSDC